MVMSSYSNTVIFKYYMLTSYRQIFEIRSEKMQVDKNNLR
jgi:hypothetical protein